MKENRGAAMVEMVMTIGLCALVAGPIILKVGGEAGDVLCDAALYEYGDNVHIYDPSNPDCRLSGGGSPPNPGDPGGGGQNGWSSNGWNGANPVGGGGGGWG